MIIRRSQMSVSLFHQLRQYPLASFFGLAYAWTWLCWGLAFGASRGQVNLPIPPEWLTTLGQFGPFAAALVMTWALSGPAGLAGLLGSLVRWRVRPVWLVVCLLLLPATMLAAILLFASFAGTVEPIQFRDSWATLPAHFVYLLLLGGPLGEEPGWRGFALPRMQARYGSVMASLWLGLLSAAWHLPLWWLYSPPCPFVLFVAGAILLNFLFTWVFNHTQGSVLYSLLFHASLSIASVRLPEVPAYHVWVPLLFTIVLVILLSDSRLRLPAQERVAA
jgi:uncharacterized protein